MQKQLYELRVDPELDAFMSPLSDMELAALEENIVANGCRTPIVVWNDVIVDGHHRYAICRKHGIPFAIEEQEFRDKNEAKLWMFQEQRSHRNLSPVARVVMALKCKPILLKMGKENQGYRTDLRSLFPRTKGHDTRKIIAELADVSPSMVYRGEKIQEVADQETMAALIREDINVSPTYEKLCKPKKQSVPDARKEQETATDPSEDDIVCYSDEDVEKLAQDIIAGLRDGVQKLIEEYNVLNCSDDMTMKLIKTLGEAWSSTEKKLYSHLMNLRLQKELLLADENADCVEIVARHNATLRVVGCADLIPPGLKNY